MPSLGVHHRSAMTEGTMQRQQRFLEFTSSSRTSYYRGFRSSSFCCLFVDARIGADLPGLYRADPSRDVNSLPANLNPRADPRTRSHAHSNNESYADTDSADTDTCAVTIRGRSPLHSAVCTTFQRSSNRIGIPRDRDGPRDRSLAIRDQLSGRRNLGRNRSRSRARRGGDWAHMGARHLVDS